MPIVRNVIMGAVARGADLHALCTDVGLTPDQLDVGDARVPLEVNIRVKKAAIARSGDPHLALHLGEMTTPVTLGMTGHLMESSPDLRTAFHNLERFTPAFTRLFNYRMEETAHEFRYYPEPLPLWNEISPETALFTVDHCYASALHIIRLLSGKNLHPLRAEYRYAAPKDLSEHERVLKVRPVFGAPHNRIVFRSADMDLPVFGHNKELNAHFKQVLEQRMAVTAQDGTFAEDVRRTILVHYQLVLPRVQDVAERMNLTPRTLQRKLAVEGTTFQRVADDVRKEMAIGLLPNPRLTIAEIAYKLGYSEPTTFQRAFRNWTGRTPTAYRSGAALA